MITTLQCTTVRGMHAIVFYIMILLYLQIPLTQFCV